MKKVSFFITLAVLFIATSVKSQTPEKLVSSKTHIMFFSTTPAEDIEANNYASVGTIKPASGELVFSVPMQSFEFEKSLMQKHFNSDKFLDTKAAPKAKLKGKITNLDQVNFSKDGVYQAKVEGVITIKNIEKPLVAQGKVTVKGGVVSIESKFNITLADHGVTFSKGKPSTNIAGTVEVTVHAEYK